MKQTSSINYHPGGQVLQLLHVHRTALISRNSIAANRSRRNSTLICSCAVCGWSGQEKDLNHSYKMENGEHEPVSLCPVMDCNSEKIQYR